MDKKESKPTNKRIQIFLIRHAESELNKNHNIICGQSNNTPITNFGKKQAKALGKMFKKRKVYFNMVYSSSALRAVETAVICLETMKCTAPIIKSDQLLEIDQGDWTGKARKEVYTEEVLQAMKDDCFNFHAPNGESAKIVEDRMSDFIQKQIIDQMGKFKNETVSVAIFSHGFAIRCFLRSVLKSDPALTWKISIDNTGIIELSYTEYGWHFNKMNDTTHYQLIN